MQEKNMSTSKETEKFNISKNDNRLSFLDI